MRATKQKMETATLVSGEWVLEKFTEADLDFFIAESGCAWNEDGSRLVVQDSEKSAAMMRHARYYASNVVFADDGAAMIKRVGTTEYVPHVHRDGTPIAPNTCFARSVANTANDEKVMMWAARRSGVLSGFAVLDFEDDPASPELAMFLLPRFCGNYASEEPCSAVARHALARCASVRATAFVGNVASIKVLRRVFGEDGTPVENGEGGDRDEILFCRHQV